MSIIERFGYDTASKMSMSEVGLKKDMEKLQQDLLEYRRQHNIFEVGDKVVFINQNMSSSIKTIKEILNDTHVSFNFHGFHVELIRHATTEEIAAGRRLP